MLGRGLGPGLPPCKEVYALGLGLGGGCSRLVTSRLTQQDRDKEADKQGRGQVGGKAGPWAMQWTRWAMGEEVDTLGWRQGGACTGPERRSQVWYINSGCHLKMSPRRMNNSWTIWSFQVNFMFEPVS